MTVARRHPEWIKVRAPSGEAFFETKRLVKELRLHTVCEEAHCPNVGECWDHKTATFMLLGDVCTRQVWTEVRNLGHRRRPVGELDDRCCEAHGCPSVDLDDGACKFRTFPPALTGSVQVPRARHAHVRAQRRPPLEPDQEVFADRVDRVDPFADLRSSAAARGVVERQAHQTFKARRRCGVEDVVRVQCSETQVLVLQIVLIHWLFARDSVTRLHFGMLHWEPLMIA